MAINLKKVDATNINDLINVLNHNFALIQNSPLYKGIPGNKGEQGERGEKGQRGNIFVYTSRATLLKVFNESTDTFMNTINGNWRDDCAIYTTHHHTHERQQHRTTSHPHHLRRKPRPGHRRHPRRCPGGYPA